MSRWVKIHCGEELAALLSGHPNSFLLLTQGAIRAKWKDCPISGLKAGEAFIGDWRAAGLQSEMAYRHAKDVLTRCKLATFRGTNKGTIMTLTSSVIYEISSEANNGQDNRPATNEQQASNRPATTNKTDRRKDGQTEKKDTCSLPPICEPNENHLVLSNEPSAKKDAAKDSLEELKSFAQEIGLPSSDGENCFHKWESTGWKGIKDWKAKMRTWKIEGFHASQKGQGKAAAAQTVPEGTIIAGGRAFKS